MRVILFSLVMFLGATFLHAEAFAKESEAQFPSRKLAMDFPVPITPDLECSDNPTYVISQLRERPILHKAENDIRSSHLSSLKYLNFLLSSDRLDQLSDELIAKAIVYVEGGGLTILADASCGQSIYLKLSNGEVLYLPLHRE